MAECVADLLDGLASFPQSLGSQVPHVIEDDLALESGNERESAHLIGQVANRERCGSLGASHDDMVPTTESSTLGQESYSRQLGPFQTSWAILQEGLAIEESAESLSGHMALEKIDR